MKALDRAIEADAYNWFMSQPNGFEYLNAIGECLEAGYTPEQIKYYMAAQLGPDRSALATRAAQAARYIERMEEGDS